MGVRLTAAEGREGAKAPVGAMQARMAGPAAACRGSGRTAGMPATASGRGGLGSGRHRARAGTCVQPPCLVAGGAAAPSPTLYTTMAQSEARRWPSASARITVALLWLPVLPPWPARGQRAWGSGWGCACTRQRARRIGSTRRPSTPPHVHSQLTQPSLPLDRQLQLCTPSASRSCRPRPRPWAPPLPPLTPTHPPTYEQGHKVGQLHMRAQHLLKGLNHHRRQH